MKRVLIIQDISCAGRCSTGLYLPVLSAMGHECVLLPTQLLSTHTMFPAPVQLDLTEFCRDTLAHWKTIGLQLDCIVTGYMGSRQQLDLALQAAQQFRCPLIVDPAMGDHGKLYSSIPAELPQIMLQLCRCADVLLPNITEACLLTGTPYTPAPTHSQLEELADKLLALGARAVYLTGVELTPGQTGFFYADNSSRYLHQAPKHPISSHGTGDLFTAVTTGALLRGETPVSAGVRAAKFVADALAATPEIGPYGVHFEKILHTLR